MDELYRHPLPYAAVLQARQHPGTLLTWVREGLRAAFFLRPRVKGQAVPWHVLAVLVVISAIEVALARLEVAGPATFNLRAWLGSWWSVAAVLLLAWTVLWGLAPAERGERPCGLASWFVLWLVATLPLALLAQGLAILQAREMLPAALAESAVFNWGTYLAFIAGTVAIALVLGQRFGLGARRLAVLLAGLLAIEGALAMQYPERYWYGEPAEDPRPRLSLSQEAFERQQALWDEAVHGLAPQRPGVRDVYGVVFAPYAREDVFLRESTMVAELLEDRFDAQGRVLQLVNHPGTSDRLPWATPLNLRRAIGAIAKRMDRERDLLVVYLTSHGGSNFKLSAEHWPLQVGTVSPGELRAMLDDAGVRHRVIAISACFSGGWVGPLASDTSLVMTAADADHTSYGCGRRSELTFFGRAMFDEQLRTTYSFEQAFAAAVPVIRRREEEAHKPDGFSNPQISVGAKLRPVLDDIARRLERAPRH